MVNRLSQETSPYLLQHQNNPVDWHPWGEEALEKSGSEQKPIFLSVGYSACHWCHVMEHESFENQDIAEFLNSHFICIKVDREERPDIDQIYMQAVQLMSGRGGWPMSVFLTPDQQPFFGGTYWPPTARINMPGFDQVIRAVDDAWQNRREQAIEQAAELTGHLQQRADEPSQTESLDRSLLTKAVAELTRAFDFQHGGFGGAPKFPHSMDLQFLLRAWFQSRDNHLLEMVILNLDRMAQGGIYDQLAGGFARYSVDARWLVPHFEKMLYDNALLVNAYLDAYCATGNQRFAKVIGETLDYILTTMTDAEGGFHSTEDADSEGEEGKFYVWNFDEVTEVLDSQVAERFCYVYDVTPAGNFEGQNILNLPKTLEQCARARDWDLDQLHEEMTAAREKLLLRRNQRVGPDKDDKILVSWNGLMIDAMARAAAVLQHPGYLEAAEKAAEFIWQQLLTDDGRLLHCWRHGQAKLPAYLDDYANLINSFVTLYESSFQEDWLQRAQVLADVLLKHFQDQQGGGFFYTADDHEALISRHKDFHDSSVPSGNSMAATALLRLGKLTANHEYLQAAEGTLQAAATVLLQAPAAAGQMLIALDFWLAEVPEIVLVGDPAAEEMVEVLQRLHQAYFPNRVIACRSPDETITSPVLAAVFAGKLPVAETPALFVCQNYSCQEPVVGHSEILAAWDRLAAAPAP